jgi:hypothetical protein
MKRKYLSGRQSQSLEKSEWVGHFLNAMKSMLVMQQFSLVLSVKLKLLLDYLLLLPEMLRLM